jgi:hypothetical protein
MRRRPPPDDVVQPPGRLLAFDPNDWLGMVDLAGYDPDEHRNRRDGLPYGEVKHHQDEWALFRAHQLWSRERHAWRDRYGWPGGLSMLDLLRQDVAERRRSVADRRP